MVVVIAEYINREAHQLLHSCCPSNCSSC